jgi:hypothetical protein
MSAAAGDVTQGGEAGHRHFFSVAEQQYFHADRDMLKGYCLWQLQ